MNHESLIDTAPTDEERRWGTRRSHRGGIGLKGAMQTSNYQESSGLKKPAATRRAGDFLRNVDLPL